MKMLGADFHKKDNYEEVNIFFRFFLETIEISIGDVITPDYPIWNNKVD